MIVILESCYKMIPQNPEALIWEEDVPFTVSIPRKLFVQSVWGSQPFPRAAELGDKSFLGKALKRVGWADLKSLGLKGGASLGAEVLLHSCIGFLWLPIEAAAGNQPTAKKRELHGEENSNKAPKVEVQPENRASLGLLCQHSLPPRRAQQAMLSGFMVLLSLLGWAHSLSAFHVLLNAYHYSIS